jgi:uncharacterized protein
VRPVWRILLFFVFFFVLAAAGHLAISPLPRHPLQWGSWTVLALAALVAGWVLLSRVDQRPPGALGFGLHRAAVGEALSGLAIGGGLIAAAVLLLLLSGAAYFVPDSGAAGEYLLFLAWTLLFFTIAATFEEAVFRGYPFQVLVEWIGVWPAVVVGSLVFSYLHGQNPNVTRLALANIFLAGVLLSIAYLKTRSLWFATGVHVGWNWSMASLFDFPVSGLGFETPLYTGVPAGEDWWTGGAFGPEAGLAGTLVLAGGTWWLARSRRLRPAPGVAGMRPLVEDRVQTGALR